MNVTTKLSLPLSLWLCPFFSFCFPFYLVSLFSGDADPSYFISATTQRRPAIATVRTFSVVSVLLTSLAAQWL